MNMAKTIAKASQQYHIKLLRELVPGVTATEARSELEAEEWNLADAALNLRAHMKELAESFRADPANRNNLAIFQSPALLRELGYI